MVLRPIAAFCLMLGLTMLPLAAGTAQTPPSDACRPISTSHHTIRLGGHVLAYTARAGFLPIRDGETGETHGCMFFIAYLRDGVPRSVVRPLTFLWNGGPGSSSSWVHLEAFGPKRFVSAGDPTKPQPSPARLEDNPDTLLDQSDLVFVDPVGTGFSRASRPDYEPEFYNVLGDIASVAEFVRVYRHDFGVWDVPLFLGGESYGVWRAAGVAETLERQGISVAGTILISGGIPVETVMAPEMRAALFIPNRTAAAFYYGKLAPDLQTDLSAALQQSSAWAETVYAPALMRADSLTPGERDAVVSQLARFTGIDKTLIDKDSLIIPRHDFIADLLKQDGKTLGSLDIRITSADRPDPGRMAVIDRYFRDELLVDDDLPYLGIGNDGYTPLADSARKSVNERWTYNQGVVADTGAPASTNSRKSPTFIAADAEAHDGPGEHQPWLSRAMRLDSALKVFVGAGWFDTWNSCLGNSYTLARLDPALARNMTARCYVAGHVIYRDAAPADQLRDDLRRFYASVLTERR